MRKDHHAVLAIVGTHVQREAADRKPVGQADRVIGILHARVVLHCIGGGAYAALLHLLGSDDADRCRRLQQRGIGKTADAGVARNAIRCRLGSHDHFGQNVFGSLRHRNRCKRTCLCNGQGNQGTTGVRYRHVLFNQSR
ncbi:hypothetical protein D3C81_1621750 [compost metagenome]